VVLVLGFASLLGSAGCTRFAYHAKADRDVYAIEQERLIDPRWQVPLRPVEPSPLARYRDPYHPDREPFTPDDPAALQFQVSERLHWWRGFGPRIRKRGVAPIEDPIWPALIPRDKEGALVLSRESVMPIAVLHGRDYQAQIELLYTTALTVSLQRFVFQVQPFASEALTYQTSGGKSNLNNNLTALGRAGLSRTFYSGGQFVADFTNNLLFQYTGDGIQTVRSTLLLSATQPLLQGAFARNITQPLSLAERQMLYAIRQFVHFRRSLYVTSVSTYLNLLGSVQGIRNTEENVRNLARNLAETEALVEAELKTLSERDAVAISYQTAQLGLLSQRAGLQTSLDAFRVQTLGLPPDLPVTIDDSPLDTFELSDPRIADLRESNDRLYLGLLQEVSPEGRLTAPPRETLVATTRELLANLARLGGLLEGARVELDAWRKDLDLIDERGEVPLPEARPRARDSAEAGLAQEIHEVLTGTAERLADNIQTARALLGKIEADPPAALEDDWQELRELVGKEFRGRLSDIFSSQTQVRTFTIELPEVSLSVDQAIAVALANRLDLMDARARVADAWRNVEVAANQLRAGVNLIYRGNLATDPNHKGFLRFDASAGVHQFGIQLNAPLVRRAQRNAYRAAWINFQQARRAYMLNEDTIKLQIRLDLRDLELARRQFDIGRQQLVTAVHQVEENEYNLRFGGGGQGDASVTLLLLQSLQSLLLAKNGLIGNWVQYETARLSLYRDMDLMDIDARGVWINEQLDPAALAVAIPGAVTRSGNESELGPGTSAEAGPVTRP
jgi:outer membrane protein TolC